MDATMIYLAAGLLISLAVTECFGLTAGGMIVPGYFALSVGKPWELLVTLLVALATFGVVRWLSQHMIVYGRRRIVLMLLFGFLLGSAVRCGAAWSAGAYPEAYLTRAEVLSVVGFIVPGLIALWFDRQGVRGTLGTLATSTVLVRLVLIVIGMEVLG